MRDTQKRANVLSVIVFLLLAAVLPQTSKGVGFLRARGQDIVDENGNAVLLQGVGLGNWLLPEGYMWKFGQQGDRPRRIEAIVSELIGPQAAQRFWLDFRRNYITEADIERIAELGFNSVRLALNARRFLTEGDNPTWVPEGFELLDNLINWCGKHHIYVIIDMHGAPGGQTGANIDDSAHDEAELFSKPQNQKLLIKLWVKIAGLYKDNPTVAGYDLLNEPLPNRTGAAQKYKDQLEPLYRRITEAIRKVDKRHMIIVEGADWANDWSVFTRPFDGNMVYQFHYYCWDRPDKLKSIAQYLSRRDELNAPVWVGETGEKQDTIYWGTTQYFEANNIGWSFWPWKKMDSNNGPYSYKRPAGWDEVAAFSRGGDKPSREVAQKAFDELAEGVKLENCAFYPDVVNALFRRVPGKVEAENYGHDGAGKSYFVKDTTEKSKLYRMSEPVMVVSTGSGGRRFGSGQGILLQAGEWTAYNVHSLAGRSYRVVARVRAGNGPAVLQLSVGQQNRTATITGGDWTETDLGTVQLSRGANRFQAAVKSGQIVLDWFRFKEN